MVQATGETFQIERAAPAYIDIPMAAGAKIFNGTIVCLDASGNANPGSDTAGLIYAGIASRTNDNTNGGAGAMQTQINPSDYKFDRFLSIPTNVPADNTWLKKRVFVFDNQTCCLAGLSANKVVIGTVINVREGGAKVDVDTTVQAVPATT